MLDYCEHRPSKKEGEKVTNNDVQHIECTFFCHSLQVNFCLQRKEPKENIEKRQIDNKSYRQIDRIARQLQSNSLAIAYLLLFSSLSILPAIILSSSFSTTIPRMIEITFFIVYLQF